MATAMQLSTAAFAVDGCPQRVEPALAGDSSAAYGPVMFRRTPQIDRNVVAAAQRRLAALAAQHSAAAEDPADVISAATSDNSLHATAEEAPGLLPSGLPRHAGPRRGEYGRWGISAQHVTVAALAVVALVVAVAWWSLRSVPHSESVQLSSHGVAPPTLLAPVAGASPSTPPPGTSVPAGQTSTGSTTRLVVDVAGKVRHPGIVELPTGSRVVDAIAAVGGARPGVSLTSLNLARLLVDGEQIVVGVDVPYGGSMSTSGGGGGTGTAATASPAPVNINTADAEQLDALPGIGPVTAQAILTWRADNGSFSSVDQLLEVSGIGDATLADLRPYVYV